ncbi:MAG: hypothetical protein WCJ71_09340 [Candidatus Omnitrophota bacterium]
MIKNSVVSDNQEQGNGTAIRSLQDRYLVAEEQLLGQLFVGCFNNKMAVLVFLIQVQGHKPENSVIFGMNYYLDDLFHQLPDSSKQERCRRVFLWLKRFLEKLPNVRLDQRRSAVHFVQELYGVFGVHLNSSLRGR